MIRRLSIVTAVACLVFSLFGSTPAQAQGAPECLAIPAIPELPLPAPTEAPSTMTDTTTDADTEPAVLIDLGGADTDSDTAAACANAISYPGPFTAAPSVNTTVLSAPTTIAVPADPASEPSEPAKPSDAADLAHSGTEAAILAYFGIGLLAFGVAALGIRRNFMEREYADYLD
jgi:hypothetical protein